jgi:hypothetical protein
MSFLAVQHYTVGDPRNAVNLLTFAEESVTGRSTPRMRAMLAARKARALSKTGDRTAVNRALHQARRLLERGPHDDDPPVLYWVTLAEIEMIAGSAALDLHDPATALRFFTGGTYCIHAVKVPGGCRTRCGGVGGHFREVGDCVEVGDRNLDHHLYLLLLVIEVDGELGDLVEASL